MTSTVLAGQMFDIKISGTHAHSWIMSFPSEYEAFKAYCEMYPNNATLLVDTYNTLKSGVPNAIRVFNEVLKPLGITKCGIRLDSGDMAYLTQKARKMLDDAGFPDVKICASGDLDENLIRDLKLQGAADYTTEVNAILHLYDLATTGVENFTEEDIPELVRCAKNSDAIYNTIIGISASNPFGIEIPDEATRTEIADAIEEYYETNSDHSSRERALYQAVAALLGLDAEVNLAA